MVGDEAAFTVLVFRSELPQTSNFKLSNIAYTLTLMPPKPIVPNGTTKFYPLNSFFTLKRQAILNA